MVASFFPGLRLNVDLMLDHTESAIRLKNGPIWVNFKLFIFCCEGRFFSLVLISIALKKEVTMSRFKSLVVSGSHRMSLQMMIIVIERKRETGHGELIRFDSQCSLKYWSLACHLFFASNDLMLLYAITTCAEIRRLLGLKRALRLEVRLVFRVKDHLLFSGRLRMN